MRKARKGSSHPGRLAAFQNFRPQSALQSFLALDLTALGTGGKRRLPIQLRYVSRILRVAAGLPNPQSPPVTGLCSQLLPRAKAQQNRMLAYLVAIMK